MTPHTPTPESETAPTPDTSVPSAAGNATSRSPVPCGTYAGYQRHRYYGEETCPKCREAQRTYIRAHRAKNGVPESTKRANRARAKAQRRLASRHAAEFEELFREELRAEMKRAS